MFWIHAFHSVPAPVGSSRFKCSSNKQTKIGFLKCIINRVNKDSCETLKLDCTADYLQTV